MMPPPSQLHLHGLILGTRITSSSRQENCFYGEKVVEKNLNKGLPIVLYQAFRNPFFSLPGK
jgi:hypothetical protein